MRMLYKLFRSKKGVSVVVAIMLMLAIVFVLAASLWYYLPKITPHKIPTISLSSYYSPSAKVLFILVNSVTDPKWEDLSIIVRINGTPLRNLNFILYPEGISPPKGEVKAGQILIAKVLQRPDAVQIVYLPTDTTIYFSEVKIGAPPILPKATPTPSPTPTPTHTPTPFVIGNVTLNVNSTHTFPIEFFIIQITFEDVRHPVPVSDIELHLTYYNTFPPIVITETSGGYFVNGSGYLIVGLYYSSGAYVRISLIYVPTNYTFFDRVVYVS